MRPFTPRKPPVNSTLSSLENYSQPSAPPSCSPLTSYPDTKTPTNSTFQKLPRYLTHCLTYFPTSLLPLDLLSYEYQTSIATL
jgi:hypothetical protein